MRGALFFFKAVAQEQVAMSDENLRLRRPAAVPDHPAAAAMLIQPLLNELLGPGFAPVSLGLDYGADIAPGEPVELEAQIIRATRTLIFAQARVLKASGRMAAEASAVFRRESAPE